MLISARLWLLTPAQGPTFVLASAWGSHLPLRTQAEVYVEPSPPWGASCLGRPAAPSRPKGCCLKSSRVSELSQFRSLSWQSHQLLGRARALPPGPVTKRPVWTQGQIRRQVSGHQGTGVVQQKPLVFIYCKTERHSGVSGWLGSEMCLDSHPQHPVTPTLKEILAKGQLPGRRCWTPEGVIRSLSKHLWSTSHGPELPGWALPSHGDGKRRLGLASWGKRQLLGHVAPALLTLHFWDGYQNVYACPWQRFTKEKKTEDAKQEGDQQSTESLGRLRDTVPDVCPPLGSSIYRSKAASRAQSPEDRRVACLGFSPEAKARTLTSSGLAFPICKGRCFA
ncbi:uncharacterized protein LOC131836781 isoform X14 [Mustela lutreola]|uniref:uncharacterized protein LOC131836781 isoform X14 n=1 Tax=Mustela lutreola TaxID=9666 RepID=UPI00279721D8|nr:uncharacterized protein LOC131836781 isoform X14 [Mustela lutreola]